MATAVAGLVGEERSFDGFLAECAERCGGLSDEAAVLAEARFAADHGLWFALSGEIRRRAIVDGLRKLNAVSRQPYWRAAVERAARADDDEAGGLSGPAPDAAAGQAILLAAKADPLDYRLRNGVPLGKATIAMAKTDRAWFAKLWGASAQRWKWLDLIVADHRDTEVVGQLYTGAELQALQDRAVREMRRLALR